MIGTRCLKFPTQALEVKRMFNRKFEHTTLKKNREKLALVYGKNLAIDGVCGIALSALSSHRVVYLDHYLR